MPNGIEIGDDIPFDDMNSNTAVAAILCFLCQLILLTALCASS
jgi:hypothetical protein